MEVYTREKVAPSAPIRGAECYHTHREVNRTMRMDTGGLCQYCARKADQRVELYSPLWLAGPIMYGECCLPLAEAALRKTAPEAAAAVITREPDRRNTQTYWLTAVITAINGFFSVSAERLHQVKLF
jgi:hypothetical protein